MKPRDWFWLYRPPVPSPRAQSIQVLHMAHAMARRGYRVTVAADPVLSPTPSPEAVLAYYGLEPIPNLRLVLLPRGRTAASMMFRTVFWRWRLQVRDRGVVYARSKRYARDLVRRAGRGLHLVLEAHEVDSVQATERGEDGRGLHDLEAEVLRKSVAVVTNAPGTLEVLRQTHARLPPAVALHNGAHQGRIHPPSGGGVGVGYVGSIRAYKDVLTLAEASATLDVPVHLIGASGDGSELEALQVASENRLSVEPPIPHCEVPSRLVSFRVLVLPLSSGLFGDKLTSPLKLWDYQASGVPMVGADTAALREAVPGAYVPYRPGDASSLIQAIERLYHEDDLRRSVLAKRRVRTWAMRAEELEMFLTPVLGALS